MEALWQAGATVQAYDPEAMNECTRLYPEQLLDNSHTSLLVLCANKEQAVHQADALVICTEWKEFRTLDFNWLKQQLRSPVLVDGRNLYEPSTVSSTGLMYFGIGRS